MQVGLNRLVDSDLDRHVPECRAFYADRGERRGPASLEVLLQARAEYFCTPLPAGVSYSGVRVSMTARLGTARIPSHIDVNAGAPISPDPQEVEPPRILGAPVLVKAYPMVMVHAEKIVTAISRGTANTRWRDFGDIYTLSGRHPGNGDELISSINVVATHRRFDLVPLSDDVAGHADIAQPKLRLAAQAGPRRAPRALRRAARPHLRLRRPGARRLRRLRDAGPADGLPSQFDRFGLGHQHQLGNSGRFWRWLRGGPPARGWRCPTRLIASSCRPMRTARRASRTWHVPRRRLGGVGRPGRPRTGTRVLMSSFRAKN